MTMIETLCCLLLAGLLWMCVQVVYGCRYPVFAF